MADPLSGVDGSATLGSAVIDLTNWKLDVDAEIDVYGSSNTAGWKNRVCGTKDWKGTISAKYNASPGGAVGDLLTNMILKINNNDSFTGNGIITSVSYDVDVNSGAIPTVNYGFGGRGALTSPS